MTEDSFDQGFQEPQEEPDLDTPDNPHEKLGKWIEGVKKGDPKHLVLLHRIVLESLRATVGNPGLGETGVGRVAKGSTKRAIEDMELVVESTRNNSEIGVAYSSATDSLEDLVGERSSLWQEIQLKDIEGGISSDHQISMAHTSVLGELRELLPHVQEA